MKDKAWGALLLFCLGRGRRGVESRHVKHGSNMDEGSINFDREEIPKKRGRLRSPRPEGLIYFVFVLKESRLVLGPPRILTRL